MIQSNHAKAKKKKKMQSRMAAQLKDLFELPRLLYRSNPINYFFKE